MAEIYSIPDNNGNNNGIPFSIPVGGFGNGFGFNNGQTNLMDLLGFAIVASIFPNMFGGSSGSASLAKTIEAKEIEEGASE